jgi:hypothetical protein
MSITSESSNFFSEINSKPQLHRFLVGDVLFELSEDLIQKRAPNSILAREERRIQFYDINRNAYIFDQPADVFEVLVYFISTGLLSRPININNIKLYSLLSYFEMDEIVLNTFKKMEHLVFEINWEKTQRFVKKGITVKNNYRTKRQRMRYINFPYKKPYEVPKSQDFQSVRTSRGFPV